MIIEEPSDFDILENYIHENITSISSLRYVSLNIKVNQYLENRGISFNYITDFFTDEEFYNKKNKSENDIKELVYELNSFSEIHSGLKLGDYFFFQLYVSLGVLDYNSFLLSSMFENVGFDKALIVSENIGTEILGFRFPIRRIFSSLILNSHYSEMFYFVPVKPIKPNENNLKKIIDFLRRYLNSENKFLFDIYKKIRLGLRLVEPSRKKILLIDPLYNWRQEVMSLQNHFNLYFFKGEIVYWGDEVIDEIQKSFDKCFSNKTFDYQTLFKRRINSISTTYIKMVKSKKSFIKYLKKIDLVLCSVAPYPWQGYMLDLAMKNSIPNIFYQHGEMNLYDDSLFSVASEMIYAQNYISFGVGVDSKYKNVVDRLLPLGSSTIKRLHTKYSNRKFRKVKTIVYVTGKYFFHATPFIDSISPDLKLFAAQKKIIEFLSSLAKNYSIIFRPSNTMHFNQSFINISADIEIVREGRFTDLLDLADLVILDSPATTCIESAAVNKLPIFCLMNRVSWKSEAMEKLTKRVVACKDEFELVNKVEDYLESGNYDADLTNDEFLRSYALGESLDISKDTLNLIKETLE